MEITSNRMHWENCEFEKRIQHLWLFELKEELECRRKGFGEGDGCGCNCVLKFPAHRLIGVEELADGIGRIRKIRWHSVISFGFSLRGLRTRGQLWRRR
ncbi:hypothetical protein [Kinneretia aquatilis]|uniref:hypothetical protein n=1 Tax=Kinneretia aquatilis TaxID=2070761 RepID=UPI0010575E5A|nr:hypothetical protein [Paucibacter aquatile]